MNIGAGETFKAWLIKKEDYSDLNSLINEVDTELEETKLVSKYGKEFKYRYLSSSEMTYQPISNWLKGKFQNVIFTSEYNMNFKERDYVRFEDGSQLRITRKLPQVQHGAFVINRKFPHILELE